MINDQLDATIAAIATPFGQGAISIVRLSGKKTFEIMKKIFRSETDFDEAENWKAIYGKIVAAEKIVDEVIVVKYQSPHSFTREDMVEINCHGGIYVTQRILELILENGARLAVPGEFTLRAFLNGRIDLSQAEAVSDLIQAQTEFGLQASVRQLEGELSEKIKRVRDQLMQACSLLELELDFAEEDVEFVSREDFISQLEETQKELQKLVDSYQAGRIAREGVKLVITGKPNVGKSSLLNALANEERAIVTDIPGTTRDALEVKLDVQGILFRIFDTAGIKESVDIVEQEGIRRAKKYLEQADIIVHVFDGSKPLSEEDFQIMELVDRQKKSGLIRVVNKSDLKIILDFEKISRDSVKLLQISALKKIGIEDFEKELISMVRKFAALGSAEVLITNIRHFNALKSALDNLVVTKQKLKEGLSSEFVAVYLREALDNLGEIIGKVTSEDILNNIFSQFCIGK